MINTGVTGLRGDVTIFVLKISFLFFFLFLVGTGCVSTFGELSGPVCKSTWNGYPSYSLLTFISRFVIDFLSIRKVIIFSAIATDDRHPYGHVLYTKMLQIA